MKERTKRVNRAYRWLIWLERIEGKNDFANILGLQRSNVTNILNGKSDASDKFCGIILSSFPGIFNRDWLLDGVGNMLKTDEGMPISLASPISEPDTQLQRQSIIDLYAGLIKESEAFRREIKDELAEVRNLRAELQQERENFRDATYRLTQALRNINPIVTTNIGIAADK
jgi:hypothetical protein